MSNQPKFTKGPWTHDGRFVGSGHAKANIAECRDQSGCWTDSSDAVANARLIAAAPAMYEALKGVLRVADRATVEFDAARAALASASGEAS